MHLSMLGPITPCMDGQGWELIGDLTAFDLKNRPEEWGHLTLNIEMQCAIRIPIHFYAWSRQGFDDEKMPQTWGI